MPSDRRTGELQQLEERILCELPRGREGKEALRVRFVRARTPEGREVCWHDIREFWRGDDGQLHPSRKGISIRGAELHAVAIVFLRAVASSVPRELHVHAKAIVAALEKANAGAQSGNSAPAAAARMPDEEYAEMRRKRGAV
jgi:hypothetical protein